MNKHHFIAAALAAVALPCSAAPAPASASAGTYTQFLCSDPDTGANVGLPEGLTYVSSTPYWQSTAVTACGVLTPKMDGSVQDRDYAAIHYEVTDPRLSIKSAEHYGALIGHAGWQGYLTLRQHGSTTLPDLSAMAGTDQGVWPSDGVINHGLASPPFASANRHTTQVGDGKRFTIAVICDVGHADTVCAQHADDWRYTLFGGRVVLSDDAVPAVSAVGGPMASATALTNSSLITFNATDQGSGLYRWRLYSGTLPIDDGSLDGSANCRDVNPNNRDPYEFAGQHPCPTSLPGTEVIADVSSLPEGPRTIRLVVEDAAGNETTVLDRTFTIDNVADPVLTDNGILPPAITGPPKIGDTVTGYEGWWQNTTSMAYAWERCDTNALCTAIPGAASLSYTPSPADADHRLRLAVTGTNRAGESHTERSAMTNSVPARLGATPDTPTTPATQTPNSVLPGATLPAPTLGSPGSSSPAIGSHAAGRLTVTLGGATTRRVKFTATTPAAGRLVDHAGAPIPGAAVTVTAAESRPGAPRRVIGRATTTPAGTFTYNIGRGASRSVTFTYTTSAATVRLVVPAQVTLRVGKASTRRTTWLTGRLQYLRRAGVKLEVQALDGRRWRTFDTTTTKKGGTYKYGYRFKRSAAGRRFALRVLVDSPLYPFARAASKAATVRVTR
jgi:hypothetical protein